MHMNRMALPAMMGCIVRKRMSVKLASVEEEMISVWTTEITVMEWSSVMKVLVAVIAQMILVLHLA
jgi:hypothetical protein